MLPIVSEKPRDSSQIEALIEIGFGPDRKRKTVYRLREGVECIENLSFVVRDGIKVVGSIRFWPVAIGEAQTPAIMLGPLAVDPKRQGEGIGRALVRHGLYAATRLGHRICVLVGDRPYYEPFGFSNAPSVGLELPGWVDPERFQVMELMPGALQGVGGMLTKPSAEDAAQSRRRRSRAA